jgi:predicted DNA-binding transcriptional regulator AlpA
MTLRAPREKSMREYHAESRLTTEEAAKVMGLSMSCLHKQRLYGRGPTFEKLGRSVRYRYSSLLSWMAAQTRRSTSDAAA